MNKQNIRKIIQAIGLGLTMIGFFVSFKWTMTVVMVLMAIGGTFYCGWLCPYGTLQEWTNSIARKLNIR